MKIAVLSNLKKASVNFHDFYPLYKWRKKLLSDGFDINFFYNHQDLEKINADLFIISNRYNFGNRNNFKLFLKGIKTNSNKIALFDAVDTSGIVDFDLIDFVDAILKKQVLKDKNLYTQNNYDISVRPWLLAMPEKPNYLDYTPCPIASIYKIKLGWNIGMCDYRYYPSYLGYFRNYLITNLNDNCSMIQKNNKNILISFRGSLKYGNELISFQRNRVLEILKKMNNPKIILGKIIKKGKYLEELKHSQIGISSFGWGEICYRDFEIIYNKPLLVKPSMDHIETFPNMYIENETYIKINWDISNLKEKIIDIEANYQDYYNIIDNAHQKFMYHQNNYNSFGNHFKNLVNSI